MTDTAHITDAVLHDDHHHGGFHGPKCWVVSALVGAVIGVIAGFLLPARHADPHAADHHDGERIIVVESSSGGSVPPRIRNRDESTSEIVGGFRLDDRESVQRLLQAPAMMRGGPGEQADDPSGHADGEDGHGPEPVIPLWLCAPFALLLLSIALMPFISERFWHTHYPDFAFLLGAAVAAYYLVAFGGYGQHTLLHVGIEYYSFIALVGGLYVASGGIMVDVRDRGRPLSNTLLLGIGSVIANIVGTTGASVLLIRPFMRMNQGRLRPIHVVFFIFIVSNCGGCLTPIGDPPLYLGFLKGVPFFWTLSNLWPMWLMVNLMLLTVFFIVDSRIPPAAPGIEGRERKFDPEHRTPLLAGWLSIILLVLLVACVFVDPLLKQVAGVEGFPFGATLQIILAVTAYFTSRPSIRHANNFTFAPVKEVGFLFIGIFLTMAPALDYLRTHAASFGLESPTHFYFGTGVLSAFLDNAPTYLSFLQVAFGVVHLPLTPEGVALFISSTYDVLHASAAGELLGTSHFDGAKVLRAVSLGAVFFGAMTYIGNGPNFMVKSIVEAARPAQGGEGLGIRMPSFFGYLVLALAILLPVLVVNWLVFVR